MKNLEVKTINGKNYYSARNIEEAKRLFKVFNSEITFLAIGEKGSILINCIENAEKFFKTNLSDYDFITPKDCLKNDVCKYAKGGICVDGCIYRLTKETFKEAVKDEFKQCVLSQMNKMLSEIEKDFK